MREIYNRGVGEREGTKFFLNTTIKKHHVYRIGHNLLDIVIWEFVSNWRLTYISI